VRPVGVPERVGSACIANHRPPDTVQRPGLEPLRRFFQRGGGDF